MSRVKLSADNYCHKPLLGGKDVEAVIAAAAIGTSELKKHLGARRPHDVVASGGVGVLHALARKGSGTSTDRRALASLLAIGIQLNDLNVRGETPLMRAAISGSWWLIDRLMLAGADPALVDKKGRDVFAHARRRMSSHADEASYFAAMQSAWLECGTSPIASSSPRRKLPRL
jgi:ankyrin repeat protein